MTPRDHTPHEWADHYNAAADGAQRDADRARIEAAQAHERGKPARAQYLNDYAQMLQATADKYRECARRSERLAERMDDHARTYGRTERGEIVTEADWLNARRTGAA
jgi:hypothetical protein